MKQLKDYNSDFFKYYDADSHDYWAMFGINRALRRRQDNWELFYLSLVLLLLCYYLHLNHPLAHVPDGWPYWGDYAVLHKKYHYPFNQHPFPKYKYFEFGMWKYSEPWELMRELFLSTGDMRAGNGGKGVDYKLILLVERFQITPVPAEPFKPYIPSTKELSDLFGINLATLNGTDALRITVKVSFYITLLMLAYVSWMDFLTQIGFK